MPAIRRSSSRRRPRTAEGKTLDSLEGKNCEVGLKGEFFGGRLLATAAYSQMVQDNYPQAVPGVTTPSGNLAYVPVQGVKTKGFEVEVSGTLTPRWLLHAGFTHKISREQGEKVATLTPENVFTPYTTYPPDLLRDRLTVGGGARWQDRTWGAVYQNQVEVEASTKPFGLFDVMARYELSRDLSLRLGINNVFDKRYYPMFNWYSTYTWGEGRNVNLTLNHKF